MSVAEAEVRMTALRAREKSHDLSHWMESFLSHLSHAPQDGVLTAKVSSKLLRVLSLLIKIFKSQGCNQDGQD